MSQLTSELCSATGPCATDTINRASIVVRQVNIALAIFDDIHGPANNITLFFKPADKIAAGDSR